MWLWTELPHFNELVVLVGCFVVFWESLLSALKRKEEATNGWILMKKKKIKNSLFLPFFRIFTIMIWHIERKAGAKNEKMLLCNVFGFWVEITFIMCALRDCKKSALILTSKASSSDIFVYINSRAFSLSISLSLFLPACVLFICSQGESFALLVCRLNWIAKSETGKQKLHLIIHLSCCEFMNFIFVDICLSDSQARKNPKYALDAHIKWWEWRQRW